MSDNLTIAKHAGVEVTKILPSTGNTQALFKSKKERKELLEEAQPKLKRLPTKSFRSNFRVKLGAFMYSKPVDNVVLLVIILFSTLTFVSLAMECNSNTDIQNAIEIIELILLVIFLCEIVLKLYAVGFKYIKSLWNDFDFTIVLMSLVLAAITVSSGADQVGVLKYSVILRLLRLTVAFRKFNDFKRIKEKIQRKEISTDFSVDIASERVLQILMKLMTEPWMQASPYLQRDIEWCIEVIRSNKLNEAILTVAAGKEANVHEDELVTIVNQFSTAPSNSRNSMIYRRPSAFVSVPDSIETFSDLSTEEVKQCLVTVDLNEFNIFNLKKLTDGHELFILMHLLFKRRNLLRILMIDEGKFKRFISRVQSGYNSNVPYHNSTHAADVTQTIHYFLTTCGAEEAMHVTAIELAGAYLAACVHDFQHPGVNNTYLVNTQAELAIRYNDKSVLENHHVAASFALTIEGELDIYSAFSSTNFAAIRAQMIDMVLSTDIVHHFATLSQFKNLYQEYRDIASEDKKLCFAMLIHAADISNQTKPWNVCLRWTELVISEFWAQGDKERAENLPLGYLMDRYTVNVAKSQIGFIDVIVNPTFDALKIEFPTLEENCKILLSNKEEWNRRVEATNGDIQIPAPEPQ